jgi:hypothetical protein
MLLLLLPRQVVLHLSFDVSVPAGLVMLAAPLLPLKVRVSSAAAGGTGWMNLRVTVAVAVLLLQSAADMQGACSTGEVCSTSSDNNVYGMWHCRLLRATLTQSKITHH